MPSLEASSSTASSEVQPCARPGAAGEKAGSAAGRISRQTSRRGGRRSTAAASRSCWASRTPTRVWMVTGTTTAFTSTTSLSSSPMPKNSMNSGIQASVGICARALKVGRTRRSARGLKPSQAPSAAPLATPASRPQARRRRLIANSLQSSPASNSRALCQTSSGVGSTWADIQWRWLATHHSSASPRGSNQGSRLSPGAGRKPRRAAAPGAAGAGSRRAKEFYRYSSWEYKSPHQCIFR